MEEIKPETHLEKVIAGEDYPTTHLEKVIRKYHGEVNDVTDVQVDGTSIVNDKVANIQPTSENNYGVIKSSATTLKVLTQAEYDALTTHDTNTLYLVRGE